MKTIKKNLTLGYGKCRARGCIEDGVELENNSLLGAMYSNDSDDAYFVSYLFGTPEMNAKFVPDFNSSMVEYMDDETNPIIVLTKLKTPSEMK